MGVKIEVSDQPKRAVDPQEPVPVAPFDFAVTLHQTIREPHPSAPAPRAPGTPNNLPRSDGGPAPFKLR